LDELLTGTTPGRLSGSVVHNESSDRVEWHVPTALCCGLALVAASW